MVTLQNHEITFQKTPRLPPTNLTPITKILRNVR